MIYIINYLDLSYVFYFALDDSQRGQGIFMPKAGAIPSRMPRSAADRFQPSASGTPAFWLRAICAFMMLYLISREKFKIHYSIP